MPSLRCLCNTPTDGNVQNFYRFCKCDWELRFGYGLAISLAVFEVKRFIVIIFELFTEWHVIKLVGGLQPMILSFIDIILGFSSTFGLASIIRKPKTKAWNFSITVLLKFLLISIITCALLNIMTLVSIGLNVTVRKKSIKKVFNHSMHLYITSDSKESDKYALDLIQFDFQCCGHSSYTDWYDFNWQMTKSNVKKNSVPFSCCNPEVIRPCIHTDMTGENIKTINVRGCSSILSNILLRIVFVAYAMGIMLVLTQSLLVICLFMIITRSCINTSKLMDNSNHCLLPSTKDHPSRVKKKLKKVQTISKNSRIKWCKTLVEENSYSEDYSLDFNLSSGSHAKQINPRAHKEHCVSNKQLSIKRVG